MMNKKRSFIHPCGIALILTILSIPVNFLLCVLQSTRFIVCRVQRIVGLKAVAFVCVDDTGGHFIREARPSVARVLEIFVRRGNEGCAIRLPGEALDLDVRVLRANDVEGVGLATSARGGRRASRDDQRAMARDLVARRAVTRMADVQVTREEHVRSAIRQRFHSHLCAINQVCFVVSFGQIEGMMCDDDLDHVVIEGTQPLAYARDLFRVDATVLDRQRARRVDAQNSDLFVSIKRL
jgi:hypothetical protein